MDDEGDFCKGLLLFRLTPRIGLDVVVGDVILVVDCPCSTRIVSSILV